MSEWIDVVSENALTVGEHVLVDVDGMEVAVFKLEDGFYAIENSCSHDGAEIADGLVEGSEITCSRHGAMFCLKTGKKLCAPAYEDLASLEVSVLEGRVMVKSLLD